MLLGLGTANAQSDDATALTEHCQQRLSDAEDGLKWDALHAACQLHSTSYEEFLGLLPTSEAFVVVQRPDYAEDWDAYVERHVYEAGEVSATTWTEQIAPLIDELQLSDEEIGWGSGDLLECDDTGRCTQSTVSGSVELVFHREGTDLRLVRLVLA
jgi:hypothetical protein